MSDHVFGFCQSAPGTKPDAYHAVCPGEYTTQFGITHRCTCPNHSSADSDKLGTKKTAPGGALTPESQGLAD